MFLVKVVRIKIGVVGDRDWTVNEAGPTQNNQIQNAKLLKPPLSKTLCQKDVIQVLTIASVNFWHSVQAWHPKGQRPSIPTQLFVTIFTGILIYF